MTAPRRPVYVEIPTDLLGAEAGAGAEAEPAGGPPAAPDEDQLARRRSSCSSARAAR